MRLKKLEITGFKSFLDKTKIFLPPGISAVVGPNGCGKSNVVDALRWVMGEQSVKQLRGKSMEDIIFAGADGKQPLNMAEVSLLMENNKHSAPEEFNDYTEIMITRRIYRSGESAYLINKQPCRLKDIHNLFLGSGTGKNSFAIIQQGNIGAITDATAEERRYFIEDAADITKFKTRKKETLSKIRTTKENLLRISDIAAEIKKQINTLNRQAAKAKQFKEYRKRIKRLDITIAIWYFEDYTKSIEQRLLKVNALKKSDTEKAAGITKLDITTETLKQTAHVKKQEISDHTHFNFETQRSIDTQKNNIAHAKEEFIRLTDDVSDLKKQLTEMEKRNTGLEIEISQVKSSNVDIDDEIQLFKKQLEQAVKKYNTTCSERSLFENELKTLNRSHMELSGEEARHNNVLHNAIKREGDIVRRLKRIDEEVITVKRRVTDTNSQRKKLSNRLDMQNAHIKEIQDEMACVQTLLNDKKNIFYNLRQALRHREIEHSRATSKYETLKQMSDNFAWYKDGVKAIMRYFRAEQKQGSAGISGLLADVIKPDAGYEAATEAALGEMLQYFLVDSLQTGAKLIHYLKDNNEGQSSFIPADIEPFTQKYNQHGHLPLLIDKVCYDKKYIRLIKALLSNTIVAESLEEALAIKQNVCSPFSIVTKSGEYISEKGILSGGSSTGLSSILTKKRELDVLKSDTNHHKNELDIARKTAEAMKEEIEKITGNKNNIEEQLADNEKEKIDIEKALYIADENSKQSARRFEIVLLEQEHLSGEQYDIEDEIIRTRKQLSETTNKIELSDLQIKATTDKIKTISKKLEEDNKTIVEHRLNITSLKAKSENRATTLKRLGEFLKDGLNRFHQLENDLTERVDNIKVVSDKIIFYENSHMETEKKLKTISDTLEKMKEENLEIETRLTELDEKKSGIKKERDEVLGLITAMELELSEFRIKRETITNRIEERYHHRLNQYKLEFEETDEDHISIETIDILSLEKELKQFNRKMKQLGNVNLGAISEFEELTARYDFMVTQQEDLEKSLEDLEKIIKKINKVSQERFITTFDKINEQLGKLFPKLFEGGSAKLILTDPSNPLETGVEIMIQPPGKKLTRLSLMSGGEKALSAIAFVFSVFLIKPASFCVMDEIDAPLDDSNVMRFNNLIKVIGEQSQILIITHNKLTMEFADILFGVTMEKRGVSKIVSVNLTKEGEIADNETAVA